MGKKIGYRVSSKMYDNLEEAVRKSSIELNTDKLPVAGTKILYNEVIKYREVGVWKAPQRGCFYIIDTSHPLLIMAEQYIRPGYTKTKCFRKHDFVVGLARFIEVDKEIFERGEGSISYQDMDIDTYIAKYC